MTTYLTRDNQELERYEKFTIKTIATLIWIPLLVGENRVRYFEASQLREVVDPRLTGMVYDQPAEPPKPLTVVLTPALAANVNAVVGVAIVVRERVTLYSEWLRVA